MLYRDRNRVERFFNRMKHCRRIATRYEKHAPNFLAMLKLAAVRLWLRHYESMTWNSAASPGCQRRRARAGVLRSLVCTAIALPGSQTGAQDSLLPQQFLVR